MSDELPNFNDSILNSETISSISPKSNNDKSYYNITTICKEAVSYIDNQNMNTPDYKGVDIMNISKIVSTQETNVKYNHHNIETLNETELHEKYKQLQDELNEGDENSGNKSVHSTNYEDVILKNDNSIPSPQNELNSTNSDESKDESKNSEASPQEYGDHNIQISPTNEITCPNPNYDKENEIEHMSPDNNHSHSSSQSLNDLQNQNDREPIDSPLDYLASSNIENPSSLNPYSPVTPNDIEADMHIPNIIEGEEVVVSDNNNNMKIIEQVTNKHVADIFGTSDSENETGSFEGFRDSEIELEEQEGEASLFEGKKRKLKHKRSGRESEDSDDAHDRLKTHRKHDHPSTDQDDTHAAILPVLTDDEEEGEGNQRAKGGQGGHDEENNLGVLSDFDRMMELKKIEARKWRENRKRFNYYSGGPSSSKNKDGTGDFVNDSDDLAHALIDKMKMAWEEDRMLNNRKQPAFKKLRLLPVITAHLRRVDLQAAFLEAGILSAFSDWLQPLPDKSLPHLQIREEILKVLLELPPVDVSALKASFIGKSVMYLFKHPKETKQNKDRAGKLINEWSRYIFNIPTDYKALSKEEREERDYYLMNHFHQKTSKNAESSENFNKSKQKESIESESKTNTSTASTRFGRARIPQPSAKDYVIRPKSRINIMEINQKRPILSAKNSRMEKLKKIMSARKLGSSNKNRRSLDISIVGKKMPF
ncbi:unnamed protein product [Gordionus sp. m RMFG-2023]|uniref:IWS1-like protein n=1 Tax=Gordionus sp. m RMFG-2023 TaxID=3053472 RepID=UPI0030E5548E